jgi:hypothetical protein
MDLYFVIFAAVVYFLVLFVAKFGFKGWSFFSVDAIVSTCNNNFYLLPFLLGPVSYVVIITYLLYPFHVPLSNVWWVVIAISVMRLLCILIGSRFMRAPLVWIIVLSLLAIVVSYGAQVTVIDPLFKGQLTSPMLIIATVIAALSAYSLFNNARFGDLDDSDSYHNMILALYNRYTQLYESVLPKWYRKDSRQYLIFFSIMITEDLNRPKVVRFVEKISSYFTTVRSTGIMQVSADSYLTNVKSIELAANIVRSSYSLHSKTFSEDYHLVRAVSDDYNGSGYEDIVSEIYFVIKKHLLII